MMNRIWMAVSAASVLLACGGGSSPGGGGSATVTGTAGGASLSNVAEAISFVYAGPSCKDSSTQNNGFTIYLSSSTGICASAQNNSTPPSGTVLAIIVNNVGSAAQPAIVPGTYNVQLVSNPETSGIFGTLTNGCNTSGNGGYAGSGTVTLTSVTSGGVVGSYNFNMVDRSLNANGSLSGNFTTTNCPLTAAQYCAPSTTKC